MVLSLLFNSRRRKSAIALMKAAKARGMSVEEFAKTLPSEELAKFVPRDDKAEPEPKIEMPDVALFDLPPDKEVTREEFIADARLAAVVDAARGGDWVPGAELLEEIGQDWDRRAFAVRHLGAVAADDDTALKAWQTARPGDPDASAVNARGLVGLAWQIRSGLRAEHVSREQWTGFFRVLEDAETAVRGAIALAPEDPTPWGTMLTVSLGRQYGNDEFRAVWAEAVARDPLNRQAHDQALQYWCKKWFGSHELMVDFAEEAAAKSPSLAVLPLIAGHEAEHDGRPEWKHERVNRALDQTLSWLDGPGRDHPATRGDRAYAAYALVENGRNEEAVEQFRHLGVHADASMWAYSGNPVQTFLKTRYLACYGSTRPRDEAS